MPEPSTPDGEPFDSDIQHGIEVAGWSNLGLGWFIHCLCGWQSCCDRSMGKVGGEFDEHLEDARG